MAIAHICPTKADNSCKSNAKVIITIIIVAIATMVAIITMTMVTNNGYHDSGCNNNNGSKKNAKGEAKGVKISLSNY
jgi:hypothetical protein